MDKEAVGRGKNCLLPQAACRALEVCLIARVMTGSGFEI